MISLAIFSLLFALAFGLMMFSFSRYSKLCKDTYVFTDTKEFAKIIGIACGLYTVFIPTQLLIHCCCNTDDEDEVRREDRIHGIDAGNGQNLRRNIEVELQREQLQAIRNQINRIEIQPPSPAIQNRFRHIEDQISIAAKKSSEVALKSYILTLLRVKFGNYNEAEPDMICSICQLNFEKEDEIVVFECNPKHFFHKQCGLDWLDIRTNCPLCQADFHEAIMQHVMTNDKKLMKHLSS